MDNYIVINGKRAELTKEQLKALGIEKEVENPFDVGKKDGAYYIIQGKPHIISNSIWTEQEIMQFVPCKDKTMVEKRAKKERLSKLLWKYANERDDEPTEEEFKDINVANYFISYCSYRNCFFVDIRYYSIDSGTQYFRTLEIAEQAIADIVEPFMKGEIE